jgi:hypothetical protein
MRLIFVPQYPTPNRYQEWWWWKFPEEFRKAGYEVIVVGGYYPDEKGMKRGVPSMFSPIHDAITFETEQIRHYMSLDIKQDDVLFLSDISFPGIFCNVLYHKRPSKMYAFCHATSLNTYDYFEDVRYSKYPTEKAHALLFDKIFVGSQYHADKLKWSNTSISSLPMPTHIPRFKSETKINEIVSASRPGKQKVDSELETAVENKFGKIIRKETKTAEEYYKFLGQSKVLLITAHEDTFGYQIVDAINNNCIPLARNKFSYPELISTEYLYSNQAELFGLLDRALHGLLPLPRLRCKEKMDNFFRTIIKEMIHIV